MDVNVVAVGKVIVDDQVDTFEVHATTHDIRADQNPHVTRTQAIDHCITLADAHTKNNSVEHGQILSLDFKVEREKEKVAV